MLILSVNIYIHGLLDSLSVKYVNDDHVPDTLFIKLLSPCFSAQQAISITNVMRKAGCSIYIIHTISMRTSNEATFETGACP